MAKVKQTIGLFSLGIVLCGFAFFVGLRANYFISLKEKDLEAKLRQDMAATLNREMETRLKDMVRQQVKEELDVYLARKEEEVESPAKTLELSQAQTETSAETLVVDEARVRETKDEAIRRIVREMIEKEMKASDRELDAMVASGGTTPELELGGMTKGLKASEFQLASAAGASTETTPADEDVTGGKERVESIEQTLVQRGSILLGKGKFQVEPSITWAHFSSNRINIQGFTVLPVLVIGDISTETTKRDIFIQTMAFKYGLFNNFQTEVRVPYRYEHDRIISTDLLTDTTRTDHGFGDVEFGVSRQIGWEHAWMPDLVTSFNVKTPSGEGPYNNPIAMGTGHWAVRGALVAAKSSDPAVIFGSASYTYTLERDDIKNFGAVKPGDIIAYSLGTAIALSYQTAINFSFDHSVTLKMIRNDRHVRGSFVNSANFKTGFTYAYNERSSMDFSVSIGLTQDSPDVTVAMRFPYLF